MASVGSVEIGLSLNTSSFDRELSALESRSLKPLDLNLKLNTANFERSLSTLTKPSRDIQIGARLDTSAVARDLRSLTQSATTLDIAARLESTQFQRDLRSLSSGAKKTTIRVEATLDVGGIEKELRDLAQEQTLIVKAELDAGAFRSSLRSLTNSAEVVSIAAKLDTNNVVRELRSLSQSIEPLEISTRLDSAQLVRDLKSISNADINLLATLDTSGIDGALGELEARQLKVLTLEVERNFDKIEQQLRSLESRELKPLNLEARLDTKSIQSQIRGLVEGDYGFIPIALTPDIKSFSRALRDLPKSIVDDIRVGIVPDIAGFREKLGAIADTEIDCLDVCLDPDIDGFRKKLENVYALDVDCLPIELCVNAEEILALLKEISDAKVDVQVNVQADIRSAIRQLDALRSRAEQPLRPSINIQPIKSVAASITGLITTPLNALAGLIASPFKAASKSIQSIFAGLTGLITTPLNAIAELVASPFKAASKSIQSIFSSLTGLITTPLNAVAELIAHPIHIEVQANLRDLESAIEDLASVTNVQIRVDLDMSGIQEKLNELSNIEINCLEVCLDPDIAGFRTKLEALYNLDIDYLPVDICLDDEQLQTELRNLADIRILDLRARVNPAPFEPPELAPLVVQGRIEFAQLNLPKLDELVARGRVEFAEAMPPSVDELVVQGRVEFAPLKLPSIEPLLLEVRSHVLPIELPALESLSIEARVVFSISDLILPPIKPISIGVLLSKSQLQRQIAALQSVKYNPLTISLNPNFDEFDRKLKSGLASSSNSYSTDVGLNTDSFKGNIESAFTDALKQVEDNGIFKGLGALVFAPLKLAAAAIAPIFLGLGAAIGLPLGQQIGTGLAKGLQSKLGNVLGSFELIGDTAGRLIGSGVNGGFSNILSTTKANAEAIVNILEKTVSKEKLTQIFGANYRTAIKDAIKNAAPGKAITQSLGVAEVLVESRSMRGADNQTKAQRKQSASSQLEVEKRAASAILTGLQQSAADFDKSVASFLEEYRTKSSSLTQQEIRQFEQTAKTIEQRKKALQKQTSEIKQRLETATGGLQTLGVAPQAARKAIPVSSPDLPAQYTDLVKEVTARSGIDKLPKNLIPKLNVDQNLRPGAFGTYDPKLNQINVSKEAQEALTAAKVDFQTIETLVHELRHAVQFGFGQIDVAATGKAGVQLERATPEEISQVGTRIESSVEIQPKERQQVARQLETDAYVFAKRNTEDIQQRLGKRNATGQFESNLGLGGAKVDLQLKRAQTQELKKIQKISALAASYGIDLQKEAVAALARFSSSDAAIAPLLEKARNLDILSVDEIQDLQQQIQQNVSEALADIGRQSEIVKNALVAKTESGKETSSTSVTEKEQRTKPTDTRIVASAPNPELETRANQLTRKQLNPVAEKLNISSRGKKTQDLRLEILKSNSSELQKALPTVISEISASIKAEADALSKVSVEKLKARGKEIHTILKQAQAESENLGGNDKSNSLKEILDAIESEQQLLKETLTRELEDDARNLLRSQQANLGKPRRKAQTEFGQLKALQSQTTRVSANKSGVQKLSQSGGNSFDSLASFEDVSAALREARLSLFNTFNKSTAAKIRRTPKISSTPTNQKLDLTNSGIDKEFTDLKREREFAGESTLSRNTRQQKHTAEINLELKTLQEQGTVRRSELEAELQRLKTQSSALKSKGLGFKPIRKRAAAGENTDIQGLQNSLQGLDALIGQIDKQQSQQMSSVVDQAKRDLAALKQLNTVASRRVRRSTKSTDAGLKGVEAETQQELSQIETDRVRKQQRLDNRLQRRYGLTPSVAPGAAIQEPTKVSDELKSVGKEIGGLFKGIQTARFDTAKKQAQALGQQARTILADIEAQITVGKGAEQQAQILNADVKRNEQAINRILQAVRRSETGQEPKFDERQLNELSQQVNELSAQIDKDQGRLAVLNQQATKGRELQPQADRLRSGIAGADKEIASDAPNLRRLQESNTEVRSTLSALGTPAVSNPFNSLGDAIAELDGGIGKLIGGVGTLLKGFLAFRAVSFLQGVLQKISVQAFQAFLEFDRLRTALNFGSGGTAAGAKNLAFVRAEVDRLRVPLGAAIKGFSQLAAATRNTALEGQTTKNIFTGVSSAATVLGLSSDDTSGVLTALTQVASKGKLASEEIKGQIGERIPGAFQIAARAMGTTEQELTRLLETGQILSEDFLPRFGQQLISEFGGSAEEASKNAQSAVFAFQNALLSLQQGIGEGIAPAIVPGINAFTAALKFLSDNSASVVAGVVALSLVVGAKLVPAVFQAIKGLYIANTLLPLTAGGFAAVARSALLFSVQAGAIFAVIEAVRAVASVVNEELAVSFETAAKSATKLAQTATGIKNIGVKDQTPTEQLGEFLQRSNTFAQTALSNGLPKAQSDLRVKRAKEATTQTNRADNATLIASDKRLESVDANEGAGASLKLVTNTLRTAEDLRKTLKANASRNFEIKGLAVPANVRKEIDDLTLKINKLNQSKITIAKPFNDDLTSTNTRIDQIRSSLEGLDDPDPVKRAEITELYGGEANVQAFREQQERSLEAFRSQKAKIESAIAKLNLDPGLKLVNVFAEITRKIEEAERAAKSFSTGLKTAAVRTQIATFGTDPDAARKSAAAQADAEIEATQRSIDERRKLLAEAEFKLAAPEVEPILARLNINKDSSIADIDKAAVELDKNDKSSDQDKQALQNLKVYRQQRTELDEVDFAQEGARAQRRIQREQDALAIIQRTAADGQAVVQRSEAAKLAAIKQRQLGGKLTEEQAAAETARIQLDSTRQNQRNNATELATLQQKHAQGIIGAEAFHDKERDLINQSSSLRQQAAEQELAVRQAVNAKVLAGLELANQKAIALIDESQNRGDIDTKRRQLASPTNEVTGRTADKELAVSQSDATARRVAQAQTELAQLDRKNFLSSADFDRKRIELNQKLGGLVKQQLDEQLGLQKRNQDDAIFSLQRRSQLEKDRGDLAIQNLEDEKATLESFNSSLDRTKKLTESRGNLSKALSNSEIAVDESEVAVLDKALEVRVKLGEPEISPGYKSAIADALGKLGVSAGSSELDILNRRQQIEDEIATQKANAQEAELRLAQELLKIDLQRERVNAESAVLEKETARDRAILAKAEVESALYEAKFIKKDAVLAEQAELRLQLNNKIVASTQKQVDGAIANLNIQDQLASDALASLNVQQQGARLQADSAEKLREVNQGLTKAEIQFKPLATSTKVESSENRADTPALDRSSGTGRKPKVPSLLDQARANPLPSKGQNSSAGVIELKQIQNARVDQSSSKGLDKSTSVEAEFNRSLGLDHLKSAEQQFNSTLVSTASKLALQPNILAPKPSQPATIGSAAQGSIESVIGAMLTFQSELLRRFDLVNATLTGMFQLAAQGSARTSVEAVKFSKINIPKLASTTPIPAPAESQTEQQLRQVTKTALEAHQPATGYTAFVQALKNSNKSIESKLDTLNTTMAAALNSPRSLTVQSPNPVQDAAKIYGDIAYANVVSSGLG